MYFHYPSLSALAAITFLTQAPVSIAGHVRHRHGLRMIQPKDTNLEVLDRRAAAGTVEIQTGKLQMLQSEITTFQGWMDTYINSTKSMDQATALAQLKQEFEAFNGWMNAFLADVTGTGPSTLPALPATKPLTADPETSVVAAFSAALSTAPASYTSLAAVLASSAPASPAASPSVVQSSPVVGPSPSTSAASVIAPELFHSPSSQPASIGFVAVPSTNVSSVAPISSAPVESIPSQVPASSAPVSPTSAPAPSTPAGGSGSSGGSFNAKSSSNVAVYYGQSGATSQVSLSQMCEDSNVDIVILAFVSDFFGAGGYPTLNLGSACSGASTAMNAKGATGLLSCPSMSQQITSCQSQGKKVLVSLGGAIGSTAFSGDEAAQQFATRLWDLFGGGTGESREMRPFGDAKVDGFDVDNEDHSTAHYSTFVSTLRKTMSADSSKPYYISAAPQCPRPDASIPLDAMQSMDFVFVQFYNNGPCDVGQPGFLESFKAWSQDLSANGAGPKIYVGAPGCQECAGQGYVEPGAMGAEIAKAKGSGVSNFGGVMLWDGPEAKGNVQGGKDYLSVVKSALA